MKLSVTKIVASCVILFATSASADVILIAKNETSRHSGTASDQHRYSQEIEKLDADSDSIAAQMFNRETASVTNTGTKKDGMTVVLMKKKK